MIDELDRLFRDHGSAPYSRKVPGLTHIGHGAQAAELVRQEGGSPSLVVAALLHDLGYLLVLGGIVFRPDGPDDKHEDLAANWLAAWFDEAVTEPIRLHVAAKRYLVASDLRYQDALSEASKRSLSSQGGAMTSVEMQQFMHRPYAPEAIILRRCDDRAKRSTDTIWRWEDFRPLVASLLV